MTTSLRQGTVLLLVIAIVLALIITGYGLVRTMRTQEAAGDSAMRDMLARDQARAGAEHAISVIMTDYLTEPFTRMDGPAHAVFQAENYAYNLGNTVDIAASQGGNTIGGTDVPVEHPMDGPWTSFWWHGWDGLYSMYNAGDMTWDGRAQYFDSAYYNLPITGFTAPVTGVAQTPLAQIPFGINLPAGSASPAVCMPTFYNARWQRINGDAATARTQARYRLRYAVGVTDLEGQLLINPDPSIDPSSFVDPDPRNYSDPDLARVLRASYAMAPMGRAYACWAGGLTTGVRLEQIFLGRGYASNYDQMASTNNAPTTFPMMWRREDDPTRYKITDWYNWQSGLLPGHEWLGSVGYWPGDPPGLVTTLYHTSDGHVHGQIQGGEVINPGSNLYHVLMGPQYSFENIYYSSGGNNGEYPYNDDGFTNPYGGITPFGRGLTIGGSGRYGSTVDTPWCVNVMTSPSAVIMAMLGGYLPAGVAQAHFTSDPNYPKDSPGSGATIAAPIPDYYSYVMGERDLEVAPLFTAFANYPGPSSSTATPDYHVAAIQPTDPGYLPPAQRYPGEICFNGYVNGVQSITITDPGSGYTSPPSVQFSATDAAATASINATTGQVTAVTITWPGIHYTSAPTVTFVGGGASTPATGTVNFGPTLVPENLGTYLRSVPTTGNANLPSRTLPSSTPLIGASAIQSGRDPDTGQTLWHPAQIWGNFCDTVYRNPGGQSAWVIAPTPLATPPGAGTFAPVFDFTGYSLQYFGPRDASMWNRMGEAMGSAIAELRGQWLQYPNGNADPRTLFANHPWTGTRAQSIQDLDGLFLANLGINIANPASPPVTAYTGYVWTLEDYPFTPGWNPYTLATGPISTSFAAATSGGTYSANELTSEMELMINDFRLAFFGSSPAYCQNFRALDLNGDGVVNCSGFPPNAAATARQIQLHLDQFVTSASAAATVPPNMFAPTGTFFMGKSKYWEVVSRGEIWDNVLKRTISEATLDQTVAIDPADMAQELGPPGTQKPTDQFSSHVLYSRWYFDKYRGLMARDY